MKAKLFRNSETGKEREEGGMWLIRHQVTSHFSKSTLSKKIYLPSSESAPDIECCKNAKWQFMYQKEVSSVPEMTFYFTAGRRNKLLLLFQNFSLHSHTHSHTHTHSLSLTHTHTHTFYLSIMLSLCLSLSHALSCTKLSTSHDLTLTKFVKH